MSNTEDPNQRPLSAEEGEKLLQESGREIGNQMMNAAIKCSKDSDQMSNQLNALKWAAIHILATTAYNAERVENADGDAYVDVTAAKIKEELEEIRKAEEAGEVDLMGPGGEAKKEPSRIIRLFPNADIEN